jgi:NAD(P)-dependent dehydrogenase (short-subunit alcohol dehydrogenase family)
MEQKDQARYDLQGRNALITGSSKGIGLETARLFLRNGAEVVVHGSNQQNCDRAVQELGGGIPIPCDLNREEQWAGFCDQVRSEFQGRLDAIVFNAGIFPGGTVNEQDLEAWQRVQRINVDSSYAFVRELLPCLRNSDSASLVFVSSAVVRMGRGDSAAYVASKSAQIGLARHLAGELGPENIRVNSVLPGLVRTPGSIEIAPDLDADAFVREKQMLKVHLSCADVAHPIAFLCSPVAAGITAASLDVNGGSAVGG